MFYSDDWAYFRFQRTGSKIISWILTELENGQERKEELFLTVREPEILTHRRKQWLSSVRHPIPWNKSHYDTYKSGLLAGSDAVYFNLGLLFFPVDSQYNVIGDFTDLSGLVSFEEHLQKAYSCDLDKQLPMGHGHCLNPFIMNQLGIGIQTYKFLDMFSKHPIRYFIEEEYTVDDLIREFDNYIMIDKFIIHDDNNLLQNTLTALEGCGITYDGAALRKATSMYSQNPKPEIDHSLAYSENMTTLVLEKERLIMEKFFN